MRVIHVLRKPLGKASVAENVLEHGCGALNIDACRVSSSRPPPRSVAGGLARINQRNAAQGYRPSAYVDTDEGLYVPDPGGRWPANLILQHREGCQRVGTRRVPTGVAVNRNKDGTSPKGMWGFAGQQGPDLTYGDGDGMETIEAWDCTPDCPVENLDLESGFLAATGRPTMEGAASGGLFGFGGADRRSNQHYDMGGASRFFIQVHEGDE